MPASGPLPWPCPLWNTFSSSEPAWHLKALGLCSSALLRKASPAFMSNPPALALPKPLSTHSPSPVYCQSVQSLSPPKESQLVGGEERVCWGHPLCPAPRTVPVVMGEPALGLVSRPAPSLLLSLFWGLPLPQIPTDRILVPSKELDRFQSTSK